MLNVTGLRASVGDREILKGLDLSVPRGEIHVVMGPNGAGKSTLAHVLMGHKAYRAEAGRIELEGQALDGLDTAARARAGLFLAFQYPVSVPGLKLSEFLRNLYGLHSGKTVSVAEFRRLVREKLELLDIDRASLQRYLNDGFSGGEMKRLEMLQLALAKPKLAILDEIDSGVDVDAQKTVADAIKRIAASEGTGFLIITHYQRLLSFLQPQKVHVLMDGRISHSGDMGIVSSLEKEGYDWVRKQARPEAAPGMAT